MSGRYLIPMTMKIILLCCLLGSAVGASQCSPKKSNPKNEQCAKELMKDGIGNLPDDLQNLLMEPLVDKLAKKLMKDMLKDSECEQEKSQQCSNTRDLGEIASPSSEQGQKMFDNAEKDLNKNSNQLKNDVSGKIGEMGQDLKNEVTGNVKNLLGDMPLPGSEAYDFLGNTTNAIGEAMGELDKKIGWAIGNSTGDAGKKMGGLMKKVTEMPKAGLDFVNKKFKGKTGDLLNKTLAAAKGEVKGLVDGFVGALGLDGLQNITGSGLDSKMNWLKNKLNSIVGDHSAQFSVGSKDVSEGVFADFLATMPVEYQVQEQVSMADMAILFAEGLVDVIARKREREAREKNMTDINVSMEGPSAAAPIASGGTTSTSSPESTTAHRFNSSTDASSTSTYTDITIAEVPETIEPAITTMDPYSTIAYVPTTTEHYIASPSPNTTSHHYNSTTTTFPSTSTEYPVEVETTTEEPGTTRHHVAYTTFEPSTAEVND